MNDQGRPGTLTRYVRAGTSRSLKHPIFDRFATVRVGRQSPAGTGIGLALVTETVATHGGRVVCGDSPGGGARFTILLPAFEGGQS
jgi:signal transduction histidine kinase